MQIFNKKRIFKNHFNLEKEKNNFYYNFFSFGLLSFGVKILNIILTGTFLVFVERNFMSFLKMFLLSKAKKNFINLFDFKEV